MPTYHRKECKHSPCPTPNLCSKNGKCVLASAETAGQLQEKREMTETIKKVEDVPVDVKPAWMMKKWWAAIVAAVSVGVAAYLQDTPLKVDPETVAKGVGALAALAAAWFASTSKSITPTGEKNALVANADRVEPIT
jgi:hypothetical protein